MVNNVSIFDVYEDVVAGRLRAFPPHTWNYKSDAIRLLKYVIEEKLKWSEEDIKNNLNFGFFKKHKLVGLLQYGFNSSLYESINAIYPNKFKPWDFKKCPQGYWTKENGIEATKWLIEEKLEWSDKDIKANLNMGVFTENKLSGMLQIAFNGSPYEAINSAYPNKFNPWEFNHVPNKYWTVETGIAATEWLIEKKLQWDDNDIKEYLSVEVFVNNNLSGMLQHVFNSSPYKAINTLYPNKFKPWEIKKTPSKFWNLETSIEATKWLIEEKLAISVEEIRVCVTTESFRKHGLKSALHVFDNSPYKAISAAYPNTFKPWELKQCHRGYWNLETGIESVKWLIEEKLKWSHEDIKQNLNQKIFYKYELYGMLSQVFNNSPFQAINAAYPNLFKPWEFKFAPQGFWNLETGVQAVKWLIEEKLHIPVHDIPTFTSKRLFTQNGLTGMLHVLFNDSPHKAIQAAYPGQFERSQFKTNSKIKSA